MSVKVEIERRTVGVNAIAYILCLGIFNFDVFTVSIGNSARVKPLRRRTVRRVPGSLSVTVFVAPINEIVSVLRGTEIGIPVLNYLLYCSVCSVLIDLPEKLEGLDVVARRKNEVGNVGSLTYLVGCIREEFTLIESVSDPLAGPIEIRGICLGIVLIIRNGNHPSSVEKS